MWKELNKSTLLACVGLLAACSRQPASPVQGTSDAGGAHGALDKGGTSLGGIPNPCEAVTTDAVGWDVDTSLGVSASQVFSGLAGECHAQLHWDGSGWGDPGAGETQVSVRLAVDDSSARLERATNPNHACADALLVDAHVELSTDNGLFADSGDVTLRYTESLGVLSLGFSHKLSETAGSFSIALQPNQSAQLSYQLDGAGSSCSGKIMLMVQSASGNTGSAVAGPIASWSASGCPLGQTPVRLDETAADGGTSWLAMVASAWSDASYPGVWDDGQSTTLHLAVSVPVTTACKSTSSSDDAVTIPVQLTYGTADGRLVEHSTTAEIRATPAQPTGTPTLAFWLSETLTCKDVQDTLPYTRGDCKGLASVEVQLGVTRYQPQSSTDLSLDVYEYDRVSTASPGAADRVRSLRLSH